MPITIVTGGSRGIGAAAARLCGAAGHDVAVVYNGSKAKAEAVCEDIRKAGSRAIAVKCDTASESEIEALFRTVDAELGPVTGLVNNAGVFGPRGRLEALKGSDIDHVMAVNVKGYFLCAREAVKRMSTKQGGKGGVIVNVSSGSAVRGNPNDGILYSASKGAVNSLTIGLAQEVGGEGIRVVAVAPGVIETDMPPPEKKAKAANPMGRIGQPEEIGEAIVWLLSDKASFVSAANIRVAGGLP